MTSIEDRQRKIDALVASVPPVVRPLHGADSCILSSHVGQDLLREVGIQSTVVPVKLVTYNRQMREIIGPNVGRLTQKWSDDEERHAVEVGARSVMTGWVHHDGVVDDMTERFVGHAVLVVRNPDGLIDLTTDQAARPEYGIHVEPCFFPMDRRELRAFLRSDHAAGYIEEDHGTGIVYVYAAHLEDRLRTSPDMLLPSPGHRRVHETTAEVCRRAFRKTLASIAPRS